MKQVDAGLSAAVEALLADGPLLVERRGGRHVGRLFEKLSHRAGRVGRLPVMALEAPDRPGLLLVVDAADLAALLAAYTAHLEGPADQAPLLNDASGGN